MVLVLVNTTIEVPRVLDIDVAWYANISLIWFCLRGQMNIVIKFSKK